MTKLDKHAQGFDFLVRRDDLHRHETRPAPPIADVKLESGQVLLSVDAFGFTANNVTYAVFGGMMNYWDFFPAPDGWGRVPVWGFATVARSHHPDVAVGERVYGYLPMSSYFVAQADHVTRGGFTDASAHRSERDHFYNLYQRIVADPGYDAAREAEQMVLRPLFFTGYLIDDFLADNGFFGARSVVISSASSKTSISLAFNAYQRGREQLEVVGLTSKRNRAFVESLGIHHRIVSYEDIESLDRAVPSVFVDMAGDGDGTMRIHRHFGDALKYSCSVGGTHWDRIAFGAEIPGVQPQLFWAPGQIAKRMQELGAAEFQSRAGEAWKKFLPQIDRWLEIERGAGVDAIAKVYLDTLDGRADPKKGYVLSPRG